MDIFNELDVNYSLIPTHYALVFLWDPEKQQCSE